MEVVLSILESVELLPSRLSVAESVSIGRRLAYLLVSLIEKLDQADQELQNVIFRVFQRMANLLKKLADEEDLIRTPAMVCITQAVCEQFSVGFNNYRCYCHLLVNQNLLAF